MQNTHYHDEDTTQAIRTLLDKPQEPDESKEVQDIINFYTTSYDFVQIVKCENCGKDLCLWILDKDMVRANIPTHHLGLRRIVLGDSLLLNKKRPDGVIGYLCICGNNSLHSQPEKTLLNEKGWNDFPSQDPHIEAMIRQKITAMNFKPDLREENGVTVIEGFIHETLVNKGNE